jgi:hypothetical protein
MEKQGNRKIREVIVSFAPTKERVASVLDFGTNDEVRLDYTHDSQDGTKLHDGLSTKWLTREEWDALEAKFSSGTA